MNKFIAHYNDAWKSEYIEIRASFDETSDYVTLVSVFNKYT